MILVVAGWSYADSASIGTIALRIVICAALLQIAYFLVVLAMVALTPKPTQAQKEDPAKVQEPSARVGAGEKLTTRHTTS
ncbi:exopolysaccharide production repressor exox [Aquamicrobium sp. LC103]|uniref:exopolysaccharide production repressor exox n=1 Tax=Aquamicrobium sp. LC103 TaxID=1120658 RepID=UPI00109C8E0B|nr:exopolysaccharide production repressor exox [Aquamicrobium sp. LC103]TKT69328.1 exopolysaccharide production repressor exox [Aquamicrobium sp. LC103]